jgi:hypothetical protein
VVSVAPSIVFVGSSSKGFVDISSLLVFGGVQGLLPNPDRAGARVLFSEACRTLSLAEPPSYGAVPLNATTICESNTNN